MARLIYGSRNWRYAWIDTWRNIALRKDKRSKFPFIWSLWENLNKEIVK